MVKRCFYCGSPCSVVELDHFPVPARLGGRAVVEACVTCHDMLDRGGLAKLPRSVGEAAAASALSAAGVSWAPGLALDASMLAPVSEPMARIVMAALVKAHVSGEAWDPSPLAFACGAHRNACSERAGRGQAENAERGQATGAVPYGFKISRVEGKPTIEIDSEQAEVVRLVFRMHASGHSMQEIAAELTARGVRPTQRKNRLRGWQISTVRAMLHNPRYIGRWTFGATTRVIDSATGKRSHRKNDAPSVEANRPELAIVSADEWQAVRDRFARTRLVHTGTRRVPAGMRCEYPLSGLLRCDACGEAMTIAGGTKGDRYYVCKATKRGRCEVRGAIRERTAVAEVTKFVEMKFGERGAAAMRSATPAATREALRALLPQGFPMRIAKRQARGEM